MNVYSYRGVHVVGRRSLIQFRAKTSARFSVLTIVHDSLVGLHDFTHLSWFYTIPLATLSLSLTTLPIAIQSRKNQRTIVALQPILNAKLPSITARVHQEGPLKTFASRLRRAINQERRTLHRRHRVNLASILAPPALKLPLWISLSLALRSMSGVPIPYFTAIPIESLFRSEGIAWMTDLTAPDTMLVLPVAFGLLNLINVEVNASQGGIERGRLRKVLERGMRVVSIAFIPIAAQMPAAVCLYWTSSAAITLCQNVWLNNRYPNHEAKSDKAEAVRERLELPEDDITTFDSSRESRSQEEERKSQGG